MWSLFRDTIKRISSSSELTDPAPSELIVGSVVCLAGLIESVVATPGYNLIS